MIDNGIETPSRDGTSQKGRVLVALDPGYVSVDERSAADFVAFAAEFSKSLKYYPVDGRKLVAEDFSQFIGAVSTSDITTFLENPERFDPKTSPKLFRPHFVLFLVFIKLLQKTQVELNSITARHLDFYYRQFLRMVEKGPIPDQVHLIVNLATRGKEVLVPRGSLLNAGPDSLGRDRMYATDRDLVVNRAQIAKLQSLYIDRRFIGFADTRLLSEQTPSAIGMALLSLAFGFPQPGDPLPPYPALAPQAPPEELTWEKLKQLYDLTRATTESTGFWLSLSELRDLMSLKKQNSPEQWARARQLLVLSGRRQGSTNTFTDKLDATNFAENAQLLGTVSVANQSLDLEAYFTALETLEQYFFMSAESFQQVYQQITAPLDDQDAAALPGWSRVDLILKAAHESQIRDRRVRRLQALHEQPENSASFDDLVREVMDDPAAGLDDLLPFFPDPKTIDDLNAAKNSQDWPSIYKILEVAQSNRLGKSVAEREDWFNLYPAEDATQVGIRDPVAAAPGTPRWTTFGLPSALPTPPAPVLGWALSSPLLCLGEGERTITVTLGFDKERLTADQLEFLRTPIAGEKPRPAPLAFEVSTAKGWLPCTAVDVAVDSYAAMMNLTKPAGGVHNDGIRIKLSFGKSASPITALPKELAAGESWGPWPVLRLLMQSNWDADQRKYVARYRELGALILVSAHVEVAVTGLKTLSLQSDDAVLDSRKPFEPFGSLPAAGARLLLGHPELVQKQLDSLAFHIKWMGAPADLFQHYANYGLGDSIHFTTKVSWVDRTAVLDIAAQAGLFNEIDAVPDRLAIKVTTTSADNTTVTTTTTVADITSTTDLTEVKDPPITVKKTDPATNATIETTRTKIKAVAQKIDTTKDTNWLFKLAKAPAALGAESTFGDDLATWTRCLQWELNEPDFQHAAYPAVAASKSAELAQAIVDRSIINSAPGKFVVKPPYTPKIKSLTLDYTAAQQIFVEGAAVDTSAAQVLHIHPFGHCDIEAERTAIGVPFLPQYENGGELYIGITGAAPPQTVSLFFQLAEGTSDPELGSQTIAWSYLDADRWVPMGSGVLLDTTRGLLNSGIVELAIKPAAPSTRMKGGLYWVRAAIARDTAVVCDTIAVYTQGVSATFQNQDNAPDHFRDPLPPATVTKITPAIPLIAGVAQPYASFGGRIAESESVFSTRVSERLRHKQRALSIWDYEQLVLERFPEVYKVKCLPATPQDRGKVSVVIIPNIKNLLPSDPFAPKAPARLLMDVQDYLSSKTPAFVTVQVKNARYVPVRVRLRVRFSTIGNEGYYIQKLSDEINRFLSPWAYDDGAEIVIGGKIYANSIIDFVDRRPYVDYVAGVSLFRGDEAGKFTLMQNDYVDAVQPNDVLVAARSHTIDVLYDAVYLENRNTGIGFMKIELDFVVTPDPLAKATEL